MCLNVFSSDDTWPLYLAHNWMNVQSNYFKYHCHSVGFHPSLPSLILSSTCETCTLSSPHGVSTCSSKRHVKANAWEQTAFLVLPQSLPLQPCFPSICSSQSMAVLSFQFLGYTFGIIWLLSFCHTLDAIYCKFYLKSIQTHHFSPPAMLAPSSQPLSSFAWLSHLQWTLPSTSDLEWLRLDL